MTVGSLFSGVEGFGLGFEQAGFDVAWQVEREPFCIAVLKTHFPNVERYYDILRCGHERIHKLKPVDVITAGFPCQDLSVAGKRAGLAGTRSGLFWELTRILGELRPPWFVIENVPGLFSSNDGADFATVLRELGDLGYGLAWRVLDSQYFGVAQRRRRVFIVGCFGKPCPAEVLFESEGGEGDFTESGQTWEGIAAETCDRIASPIRHNDGGSDGGGPRGGYGENLVAHAISASAGHHGHSSPRGDGRDNLVTCLESGQANASIGHGIVPNLTCLHEAPIINIQDVRGHRDKKQNGIGISSGEPCYTLDGTSQHAVAFAQNQRGELRTSRIMPQLTTGGGKPGEGYPAVMFASLSGIGSGGPDDNDAQAHRIIERAPADSNGVRDFAGLPEGMDSARYRALGNAVTASVAKWIATRIKAVMEA